MVRGSLEPLAWTVLACMRASWLVGACKVSPLYLSDGQPDCDSRVTAVVRRRVPLRLARLLLLLLLPPSPVVMVVVLTTTAAAVVAAAAFQKGRRILSR